MITFQLLGRRDVLDPVCAQLVAAGASAAGAGALILIGATSVPDAESSLAQLTIEQRRRSILVGIYERPERQPSPGSVVDLLERFQALGAVHLDETGRPTTTEFVSALGAGFYIPKLVDASWLKGIHSPNYGLWIVIEQPTVGELLVQLVSALEQEKSWFEDGPLIPYQPRRPA